MSTQKKVLIGGVDVSSFIVRIAIERTYADAVSTSTIELPRTVSTIITPNVGSTVEIWSGNTTPTDKKRFSGYVESISPEGGRIVLKCKDKLWDLVRKEVSHVYDASIDLFGGKLSLILQDLVTTYGGLNADATSIQDSGSTIVASKFVCNNADIFERCKALAAALDWQLYYRADTDKVYFEPRGFNTNPATLEVGTNVIRVPKWEDDITELVNDLKVVGASQLVETTETGQIGVTTGFQTDGISIGYEPESVKVYADNANPPTTLLTGGVIGSTAVYDYSVDKNQKRILPFSSFVSNDYAEVRYSFKRPTPIRVYSQSSIDAYGRTKKTITLTDVRTVQDAELRGRQHLARYSTPFTYTTLNVRNDGTLNLNPGELIQVIDNINRPVINGSYLINRHVWRWPADYEEVYVGDKEWRMAEWQGKVEERLKRLEEGQYENQDIIVELIDADTSISSTLSINNRFVRVEKQEVTGDGFIFGHPTYGVFGTSKFGNPLSEKKTHRLVWENGTFVEDFIDTEFLDTSNTNANWNTTDRRLELP